MLKFMFRAYKLAIVLYVLPRAVWGWWLIMREVTSVIKDHIKK
jgi:hypothetical protein